MNGSDKTASGGAPLRFPANNSILSAASRDALERGLKYLASRLASTADRQDDLLSVGLRAIHYAFPTYERGRGASVETFLIRCAYRAMLDVLRTEVRQTGAWTSGDSPVAPGSPETLFHSLEGQDLGLEDPYHQMLLHQVELAIRQLPDRQRECVRMYYYDGHNNSEIAALLGISRPRVSQLLTAAMMRLRARFGFRTLTPTQGIS